MLKKINLIILSVFPFLGLSLLNCGILYRLESTPVATRAMQTAIVIVEQTVTAQFVKSSAPLTLTPVSQARAQTPAPRGTDTPRPTSPSTPVPTSTNTPISNVMLGVATDDMYIREGPSIDYPIIDGLRERNEVLILGINPSQSWFKVVGPNVITGWVTINYIDTTTPLEAFPILVGEHKPATDTAPIIASDFLKNIDIEGESSSGQIDPGTEHWYTFTVDQPKSNIVLMFKPNVNFFADNFTGYNMQFALYTSQVIDWPPENADHLDHVGLGLNPYRDRDGLLDTGELIWSGPLTRRALFYLRIVNKSSKSVEYCLAPKDVFHWSCD